MWGDSSEANRGVPLLRLASVDVLWRASEPGVLERLRQGRKRWPVEIAASGVLERLGEV